jgi:hypothetical protein
MTIRLTPNKSNVRFRVDSKNDSHVLLGSPPCSGATTADSVSRLAITLSMTKYLGIMSGLDEKSLRALERHQRGSSHFLESLINEFRTTHASDLISTDSPSIIVEI